MKQMVFLITLLAALSLSACSTADNESSESTADHNDQKTTVAVTIVPEKTFVKQVGGDHVNVVTMVPPGQSPENYDPSPKLMEQFSNASLYFTIGVPAEKANILSQKTDLNADTKIVNLADAAKEKYDERTFPSGKRDPHVWLSPKRAIVMVNKIKDELSSIDPEHASSYNTNAKHFIKTIKNTQNKVNDILKDTGQKSFMTYHPAFGYFAKEFDLNMIALEKEGKDATPQRLQHLTDKAKTKGIKVIFYQAEIDSKQSKAFAEEINGKTVQVSPLAPDYNDNLLKMAKTFKKALE